MSVGTHVYMYVYIGIQTSARSHGSTSLKQLSCRHTSSREVQLNYADKNLPIDPKNSDSHNLKPDHFFPGKGVS